MEKVDLKTIFAVVICAIIIAVGFIINKKIISIIGGAVLLILVLIFSLLKIRKSKTNNINIDREIEKLNAKISSEKAELESKNYNQNESIKEISALKGQVSLLKETNSKLGSQAKEIKEKIDEKRVEENDSSIDVSGLDDLNSQIKQIEDEIYEIKNNINKIETEELYILPQLDELVSLREEKFDCEEKLKELKEEEEIINIAIETLEAAYEEMKTSITPKFTKKLSENINKISNGKYFNVTINDESGMIVETESGNYIDIDKLSVGTIDALYFALRLSMIEDLSEEKMPILLDETFAYFDNNRLEAALRYLIENQSDHQVVLFTCSDREIEILNKMREEYNLIEL